MKFFAGSSNIPLAEKVAQKLGLQISQSECLVFADGEVKPVIKEDVRDQEIVILQSTTKKPNDYWMELFLTIDALKREAAKKIITVIPAFGYARQNQQHQKGEPVSAHVIVHILENLGVSEVITVDLHDETMTGMFDIPITNVSALPLLAGAVKPALGTDFVVVAPDQGGVERARLFCQSLGSDQPIVIVEKKRDLDKAHQSQAVAVMGEVRNKTVVIQDDIITSGGTILNAANALMEKGAKEVYVCVTHEDFAQDTSSKLQNSQLTKMFITNSVVTPQNYLFPKLEIVDISDLLADQIKKFINH